MLRRAVSIRIMFGCIIVAAVITAILSLLWKPLEYLFVPLFLIVYISTIRSDDFPVVCPHCAKRVKLGADTCHHCGKSAVPA